MKRVSGPLIVVVVIYFVTVLVLWLLSKIGPITAVVEGIIEHGGANIWFAAGGVMAAFIIIAAIGLLAVYLILKLLENTAPSIADSVRNTISLYGLLNHL